MSFVPLADQVVSFDKIWSTFRILFWSQLLKWFIPGHPGMFKMILLIGFFSFFFWARLFAFTYWKLRIFAFALSLSWKELCGFSVIKALCYMYLVGSPWIDAIVSKFQIIYKSLLFLYEYTHMCIHLCLCVLIENFASAISTTKSFPEFSVWY